MKRLMNAHAVLGMLGFFVLASTPLFAQEWSASQKDVWKNVETYWALETQQDLEGFLRYFHEDYRGWNNHAALPVVKATLRKVVAHDFQTTKRLLYDIQPVAIQIHGNVAFVHYYFSETVKEADGKEKDHSGRWTDILMQQGDKWVLIGDHGGRTSKD